jgi:hypothetical protein
VQKGLECLLIPGIARRGVLRRRKSVAHPCLCVSADPASPPQRPHIQQLSAMSDTAKASATAPKERPIIAAKEKGPGMHAACVWGCDVSSSTLCLSCVSLARFDICPCCFRSWRVHTAVHIRWGLVGDRVV